MGAVAVILAAAMAAVPAAATPPTPKPGLAWFTDRDGTEFAQCSKSGVAYRVAPGEPLETADGTLLSLTEAVSATGVQESVTLTVQLGSRTEMRAFIISAVEHVEGTSVQFAVEMQQGPGQLYSTTQPGDATVYQASVCTGAAS